MSALSASPVAPIVPAKDLARAKRFYEEILGLQLASEEEGRLEFRAGHDTSIVVYPRPEGEAAEHTVAGWRVDDLEAAMEDLRSRGVSFERYDMPNLRTDDRGVVEANGMRGAWFKDTEGNILSIAEYS
jgi:catechol 2,3-dioxygenase-like lactoylglutathione lyase family enzyme